MENLKICWKVMRRWSLPFLKINIWNYVRGEIILKIYSRVDWIADRVSVVEEEESWNLDSGNGERKRGGPQGRIFLSRQYLSSLCPVVNPASFSPAREGGGHLLATFDYKRRPILSPPPPPFVANEPCVFMRFATRLPDPDARSHPPLIGIYL